MSDGSTAAAAPTADTPTVGEAIVDALVAQIRAGLPAEVAVDAHRGTPVEADARPAVVIVDDGEIEAEPEDLPAETHADARQRAIGVHVYTAAHGDDVAAWRAAERMRGLIERAVAADPTAGDRAIDVTGAGGELAPDGEPNSVGVYAGRVTLTATYQTRAGDPFTPA